MHRVMGLAIGIAARLGTAKMILMTSRSTSMSCSQYMVFCVSFVCCFTCACDDSDLNEKIATERVPPLADAFKDAEANEQQSTVRANLEAFLEGNFPPPQFEIVYDDSHPLHQGLSLRVWGSGKLERFKVEKDGTRIKIEPEGTPHRMEINELVKLLIELEAWKQIIPYRPTAADESKVRLQIRAGDQFSSVWEWYNDMEETDRLIRIRDKMKDLGWAPSRTPED